MSWDPAQYLKFADARLRPALDLLAHVDLAEPGQVCDLGCGTGSVTRLLAARWPAAAVTGVDGSAAMLEQARATVPGLHWVQGDIATWTPAQAPDLCFSNAALHWLPDHARLLPRLLAGVAPGGVLAVQMPRNFDAPSHTAIAETVRAGAWRDRLEPLLRPAPVSAPAVYHGLLRPGTAALDIWETEYLHELDGPDPVKEWVKGTWLKPLLDALPPDDAGRFEQAYAARLREAYPSRADGRTLLPFRRLFIVARRAAATGG